MQRVCERKEAGHLAHKVHVLALAVVDGAGDAAVLPVLGIQLAPLQHQLEHFVLGHARSGQPCLRLRQVLDERRLDVVAQLVCLFLELALHKGQPLEPLCDISHKPRVEALAA